MTSAVATLRAAWRASLFLILTFGLIPPFLLAQLTSDRWSRAIVRSWSRGCLKICGIEVTRHGRPCPELPALLVANHVSYLDIPVIAAHVPVIFIAKREVRSWPLFGFLARISRTVFIDRIASHAARQCRLLRRRLRRGETLLLFPEGTSSDGSDLLPFKSSLFEAVQDETGSVPLQPLSLAYLGFSDGTPFASDQRELYAWTGDATMLPHLWRMMKQPGAEVVLHFHPPARPEAFASRKALSAYAFGAIRQSLRRDLEGAGRRPLEDALAEDDERPAIAPG
ncbi:MAG: lysophospholipid acyltransferase family protein [Geminicoccaceae bacterium]|nr:lysophospholipid acyltransferase family protein [Geminicoccaceae bacterium]